MKKLILAAAVATLSMSGAYAAQPALPGAEPEALRVSTRGLNLSNPGDIAMLRTRIDKAIDSACSPHGSYFSTLTPQRECRAALISRTNVVLAELTQKAKSQMAEF